MVYLVDVVGIVDVIFNVDSILIVYNVYSTMGQTDWLITQTVLRLALMRRTDSRVLLVIRQRNRILAVHLKPLVYLVKVDDPALAWLSSWNVSVCEFLVDSRKWNVGVLGNLLWSDRPMSVLSLLSWSFLKALQ